MKIIAGKLKGRNFFMPKEIRPTQNIVRAALFNILGEDLHGKTMLELFAGSGAVGFEALSRGAKSVTFVERDDFNVKVLNGNIELLGLTAQAIAGYEVLHLDALMSIKKLSAKKRTFDIVFADPPYGKETAKKTLKTLGTYVILHAVSLVVIQHDRAEKLPETEANLSRFDERKYGSTVLSFYRVQL